MTVGIYNKLAKEIMTKHVATVRTKETVHEALLIMAENRLTALPVVDQSGACVGIFSQSDVISIAREADEEDEHLSSERALSNLLFGGVPLEDVTSERIEDVMTDKVVTARPDEKATSVADKMIKQEIHHVPVCDDSNTLLGIISTMDILRALRR